MKYSIKVNEVRAKEGSNIKGFATVVFGDSFKITNIAILENKDKGELFVSMPRYRSNERDESNGVIYKDVCNPITAEFREELYTNILDAYARIKEPEKEETQKQDRTQEMPEFSVTVTPYEREGSNIKGLARIYFENSFIVNNINIVQGKEKIFVSMPSYKTKQVDEQGKPIYQDVCYPVTKDFREKLYNEIISEYEKAKDKSSDTLYNAALPFSFASSTMLFAVDLTCAFTSNTCDFICSHLVLSRSRASDNAFLALLTSVSSCISLIWFCMLVSSSVMESIFFSSPST
jgi:DNA-binding cell septation regulator SpoVG